MATVDKKLLLALKDRGYKVTPQRKAVLNVVVNSSDHLTAADIYEQSHKLNPRIGLATVYRTLDILLHLGLVCQIHARGSAPAYIATTSSECHHHLVCIDCGTVIHFTECDLDDLELRMSLLTGYDIKGHFLQLTGRCSDCQQRDKKATEHN